MQMNTGGSWQGSRYDRGAKGHFLLSRGTILTSSADLDVARGAVAFPIIWGCGCATPISGLPCPPKSGAEREHVAGWGETMCSAGSWSQGGMWFPTTSTAAATQAIAVLHSFDALQELRSGGSWRRVEMPWLPPVC